MKTVDIKQATAPLADYAHEVKEEPVIVTMDGKPIAALVPLENAGWETVRLSTHPQFLTLIERSRSRHKAQGGVSSADMRRHVGS